MSFDDLSEIGKLYNESVSPRRRLSEEELHSLEAMRRIINQNYLDIEEFIDGPLDENPLFIARTDIATEATFEVYRYLHNYLASLYSFNDHLIAVVDRLSDTAAPVSVLPRNNELCSAYVRKISFLRGLRNDCQHGGFSSLTATEQGRLGDFSGYHIEFDRSAFVANDPIDDPAQYLAHTNDNERRYPMTFVARFHQRDLDRFYNGRSSEADCWSNRAGAAKA